MKKLTSGNRLFVSNNNVNETQEPLLHIMNLVHSGSEFRFEVVMSFTANMSVDNVKQLNDYLVENNVTEVMNLSTMKASNVHIIFESVLNNLGIMFRDFVVEFKNKLNIISTKNIPRTINILSSLVITPNFIVGGLCDETSYASRNTQKVMGLFLAGILDKDLSTNDLRFLNDFLQVKELQSTLSHLKRYCNSSLIVPINTLGRLNSLKDDCDRVIDSMHSFCASVKSGTNVTTSLNNCEPFRLTQLVSVDIQEELEATSFTVLDYIGTVIRSLDTTIKKNKQLAGIVEAFDNLDSLNIAKLTQSDTKCVRLLDRLLNYSNTLLLYSYVRGFYYVVSPTAYNAIAVELLQLLYDITDSSKLELEEIKFIVNALLRRDYSNIDRYFFKLGGKSALKNPVGVIHVDTNGKVVNVLGYVNIENNLTCNKNKVVFSINELEDVKLSLNQARRAFITKYSDKLNTENTAFVVGKRVKNFLDKTMTEQEFETYLDEVSKVIFNGDKNYLFRKVYYEIHALDI